MKYQLCTVVLGLMLSGCVVGPDYQAPAPTLPERFSAQDIMNALQEQTATAPALSTYWWQGFNDPTLDTLVTLGLENSFSLAAATARVRASEARLGIISANTQPQLGGTARASTSRESQRNNTAGTPNTDSDDGASLALNASLTLDIFGRNQRALEEGEAQFAAAQAALHSELLSVTTQIAQEYLSLRGNDRQLELLKESVALQSQTLAVVRARFNAGLAPELDLQRAKASVERLGARIPPLTERSRNARNRLATLTGYFPGHHDALLATSSAIPTYRATIPLALPATVLSARPDVREAEAVLKQAVARIGIAEADFYPRLALAGDISLSAASGMRADNVLFQSLSALIDQVLWSGGRRDAALAVSQAQAEEALANYQRVIRSASERVEMALTAIDASSKRTLALANSVAASQRSFAQAQTLYQLGLISFLDVVEAQRSLADDEQNLAAERTDYATDIARLFEALGTKMSSGISPYQSNH